MLSSTVLSPWGLLVFCALAFYLGWWLRGIRAEAAAREYYRMYEDGVMANMEMQRRLNECRDRLRSCEQGGD